MRYYAAIKTMCFSYFVFGGSPGFLPVAPGGTSGKGPTCQRRRHKRRGFHPWVEKIPGGGHGNPFQYSCLENPTA